MGKTKGAAIVAVLLLLAKFCAGGLAHEHRSEFSDGPEATMAVHGTGGALSGRTVPASFSRSPLVFLSTAPPDSLLLLPGIGPVLAERIVAARTGKSSFTEWDDLLEIKGIGPKTIERLRALSK